MTRFVKSHFYRPGRAEEHENHENSCFDSVLAGGGCSTASKTPASETWVIRYHGEKNVFSREVGFLVNHHGELGKISMSCLSQNGPKRVSESCFYDPRSPQRVENATYRCLRVF